MLHLSGFRMLFVIHDIVLFLDCISISRFCRKFKLHHGTANRYVGDIKAILTILFFTFPLKLSMRNVLIPSVSCPLASVRMSSSERIPYTRSSFINPRALRFFRFPAKYLLFSENQIQFPESSLHHLRIRSAMLHVPWYLTQQNGSV